MCHYCLGNDAPEIIKCRCGPCDGLEQDVCVECHALFVLSKKDFPNNFRAAWDQIKERRLAGIKRITSA